MECNKFWFSWEIYGSDIWTFVFILCQLEKKRTICPVFQIDCWWSLPLLAWTVITVRQQDFPLVFFFADFEMYNVSDELNQRNVSVAYCCGQSRLDCVLHVRAVVGKHFVWWPTKNADRWAETGADRCFGGSNQRRKNISCFTKNMRFNINWKLTKAKFYQMIWLWSLMVKSA